MKTIIEQLKEKSKIDLLNIHNDYCSEQNMDDFIYSNDSEFFEMFFSNPEDLLRAALYGPYEYNDEYVVFNGYGNLDSFEEYSLLNYIDIHVLAEWIEDNELYYEYNIEQPEEVEE